MRRSLPRRSLRGSSLGVMLAVVTLAMLAAFTMAGGGTFNLLLSQRVANTDHALQLAESAVNQATAYLMENSAWTGDIHVPPPPGARPGDEGLLTFNRTNPWSAPYSTNNGVGGNRNGWNGQTVPDSKVHLIGRGSYNGIVRYVDVMVHVPNFTISVASTGVVSLRNAEVASIRDPADVTIDSSGRLKVNPEAIGPGDLATNSGASGAINLDPLTHVTGNVQACGTVEPNGGRIDGEVRYPADPIPFKPLRVEDYDPENDDPDKDVVYYTELAAGSFGSQNLAGICRASGGLTVNGDLVLDNSLVYVKGPLKVFGAVRGQGTIVVKGDVLIQGSSSLGGDDTVALLVDGNVVLKGNDRQRFDFRGMVRANGDFSATKATVMGAFLARNVTLTDATAYYSKVTAKPAIYYPRQAAIQLASCNTGRRERVFEDGNEAPWGQALDDMPDRDTPQEAATWVGNGPPPYGDSYNGDPFQWYDSCMVQVALENDQPTFSVTWVENGIQNTHKETNLDAFCLYVAQLSDRLCPTYTWPPLVGDGPVSNQTDFTTANKAARMKQRVLELAPGANGTQFDVNFDLDPNRFLNKPDQMRVVIWREY